MGKSIRIDSMGQEESIRNISMRRDLEKELEHARVAYLFSMRALPDPATLINGPVTVNGIEFRTKDQVKSVAIELGWAFYCRYEACLEAFIKEHKVPLSRKYNLEMWMSDSGIQIPDAHLPGLTEYRRLRNILHHDDGRTGSRTEVHLFPEHMARFYDLFIWIASAIAANPIASRWRSGGTCISGT
ncbi:MAG: hypothetical protein GC150_07515 [Rhizobiales bacterium]|nr:hypothetical protein [Hyphomicrobiales bacterium]